MSGSALPAFITISDRPPVAAGGLDRLYSAAFPTEDLTGLVRALAGLGPDVLLLTAAIDDEAIGHVAFTLCRVEGPGRTDALLGPLAVLPEWQKRGVGGALVCDGLRRLAASGVGAVHVLGDPAYYRRFGFAPHGGVAPPYPLPDDWAEAWQSLALDGTRHAGGSLVVPPPWRQPALWSP